ncbi:MAG: DMT family transporter, partial [Verrucomicrobia bacterium]|nr:DMT family transporter [Verrucomicrobiota bacterium]
MPSPAAARSQHSRGVALMLASTVSFTANVLIIRALGELEAVNVWLVSCVRFVAGLAVILAVFRREFAFQRLFTQPRLIGRGVAGGASVYLFYLTVVHLGAGRATFINNTYVIFGALLAVVVLGEKLRAALAASSLVTLGGLALLTNAFGGASSASLYDLLGVVSALAASYVVVTIRQLHATDHSSTIFAAQCIYGLAICVVPAGLKLQAMSTLGWTLMILAGLCAAVGQITMTRAFRDLPVAEGSLLQMLVPLGTATGGAILFGERFTV